MRGPTKETICNDTRPCFARDKNNKCSVLRPIHNKDYAYKKDGECKFCKAYNPPFEPIK